MNKVLSALVILPAILFVVTGVRWLVDDAALAPQIGVEVVIAILLLVASRRLPRGA